MLFSMLFPSHAFLCLITIVIVCTQGIVAQTCYFPSKDVAPGMSPCNASATVNGGASHCCDASQVCLDNGYCLQQYNFGNRITRSGCTDQTFPGPACPQYCLDVLPNQDMSVLPVKDFNPGMFCCGGWNGSTCNFWTSGNNPNNNNPSPAPFSLANSAIIFNRTSGSTGPNNTVSVTTITVTATAGSSAQTTSSNNDAAVGAGVGAPLGILLVASLALLWIQRKRVKMLERQLAESNIPAIPVKPTWRTHGQPHEMDGHNLIELGATD